MEEVEVDIEVEELVEEVEVVKAAAAGINWNLTYPVEIWAVINLS